MTTLANLTAANLASLYNGALVEYGAPEGFSEVAKFKSRAAGVNALEALCKAGGLAVAFDGDKAVIVDTLDADSVVGADGEGYGANDDDAADKAALEASEAGEGDDADGEGEEAGEVVSGGADGKGKARAWGFVTASADWLAANPRGTEAREAYRTERRKAARLARKAERKAKEAAQEAANA